MPFFRSVEYSGFTMISCIINDTLQVRKPEHQKNRIKQNREKRVWAFTSSSCKFVRNEKRFVCRASVSVEAALALSIFIFAMVCMMIPFRMMERQRQVQASLESVNEGLCQYAYLEYMLAKGEEIPKEDGDWKQDLLLGIVNHTIGAKAESIAESMFPKDGMKSRSFSGSAYLEDGEMIKLCMDYQMQMPFSIFHFDDLSFSSGSIRRAWIGRDGLSQNENQMEDEEDPIVYIGKTSVRYHKSKNCHYLSNQLQTVDYSLIASLRNQNGGKYYPCAVCGGSKESGMNVFIMKSGSRYHTSKNCSAIIAYVQEVKLSTVKHLGGCSYCCR
jgi:hypothetical protein